MPRLLLISDLQNGSAALAQELLNMGYEISAADSVNGIVDFPSDIGFDLALIDAGPAATDLPALVRRAKSRYKGPKIIVLVSPEQTARVDIINLARAAGADDAVFRPYLAMFLLWRIDSVLGGTPKVP